MNNYTIIWKHFIKESGIGVQLGAQEDFSLPYFVDGQDKIKFEKKEAVDLYAIHLIRGLLVGYFDKPPEVSTKFAQEKTLEILEEQLEASEGDSLEEFILEMSYMLRDNNGQEVSLQALMTGTKILPKSDKIKYDCCIDLINCIDEGILEDKERALQQLDLLLDDINEDNLDPELISTYEEMFEIAEELRE